jgi:hypothetical protein
MVSLTKRDPNSRTSEEINFFKKKKRFQVFFFNHSSGPVQLTIALRESYPKRIKL